VAGRVIGVRRQDLSGGRDEEESLPLRNKWEWKIGRGVKQAERGYRFGGVTQSLQRKEKRRKTRRWCGPKRGDKNQNETWSKEIRGAVCVSKTSKNNGKKNLPQKGTPALEDEESFSQGIM